MYYLGYSIFQLAKIVHSLTCISKIIQTSDRLYHHLVKLLISLEIMCQYCTVFANEPAMKIAVSI